MVGANVLIPPRQFWISQQNHTKNPEIDSSSQELECISLIKKCRNVKEFKQVHCQILKLGFLYNSFCASNLVATCAISEWGSMDYACSIFHQIDDPGVFDFNIMVRGYIKDINWKDALYVYVEMLEREIQPSNFTFPAILKACAGLLALEEGMQIHGHIYKLGFFEDLFVQNSLINVYGKCGELTHSCAVFAQMDQKTIASWSALIAAQANSGMWDDCLMLFRDMNFENCWRAEESTLVSVLSACTHLGILDLGRSIHGYLLRNFTGSNIAIETSLIDMYMKCGSLDKAMCLFRKMSRKNEKTYSVMISGLAIHGHCELAISVFEEMLEAGLDPDGVVYVGILVAFSHAGLVQEGMKFFDKMRFEDRIEPTIQHYGCIVDLMGKAGMVTEAFEIIKNMPMDPNDVIWRALLSACKIHQNLELGEIAAENLFRLKTENPCDYLLLSDIYAREKRWKDVSMIRTRMAREVLHKVPGSCSVEVKRRVYKFVSDDKSRRDYREIYEMIHQMEWQLKFHGYKPDTSEVLLNVDEEEKKQRLSSHSQKLAIAFSLINTSEGSCIRIVRNVRMCSDCHRYNKLISVIYEREIIVKDRNVFHHFRDGNCSCKDYW